MTTPVISVHTPVYNAERYVGAAIESVLNQTFADFEYIIINDGSTDGSLDVIQPYARRDERIRLVSRENRGIGRTRNEALSMAGGEFFAAMDADDISMPDRFQRQVEFLRAHPDYVATGSYVLLIDPDGAPICEWSRFADHEEIDRTHMEGRGGAITHPAAMMRRDVMNEIGGYTEALAPAEDYDLFLRLAERGRLANVPEVLFEYRQHSNSVGYDKYESQKKLGQTALADAYRRRGLDMPPGVTIRRGRPASETQNHRKWAWWALSAGNVATARKHARVALRRAPFSLQSWKTMFCALRGS